MKLYNCIQAFLCAITTTKTVAYHDDGKLEWGDSAEFGRTAKRGRKTILYEPSDVDLLYRELMEAEIMEMSMSMSMSMSFDYNTNSAKTAPPSKKPTGAPTSAPTWSPGNMPTTLTPAPSVPLTEESNSSLLQEGCNDEPQDIIAIPLEVDTAVGKTSFEVELADAMATALSDDYTICGSRRLEDGGSVSQNILLGNITVFMEFNETCTPKAATADSCHTVYAQLAISGGVDGAASGALLNALSFIFENDITFTDDLPMVGVMAVRLKDVRGESEANSMPNTFGNASQPTRSAVVAILSAAGFSIIAAIAFRVFKRGNDADKYSGSDYESEGDTLPFAASNSAS